MNEKHSEIAKRSLESRDMSIGKTLLRLMNTYFTTLESKLQKSTLSAGQHLPKVGKIPTTSTISLAILVLQCHVVVAYYISS